MQRVLSAAVSLACKPRPSFWPAATQPLHLPAGVHAEPPLFHSDSRRQHRVSASSSRSPLYRPRRAPTDGALGVQAGRVLTLRSAALAGAVPDLLRTAYLPTRVALVTTAAKHYITHAHGAGVRGACPNHTRAAIPGLKSRFDHSQSSAPASYTPTRLPSAPISLPPYLS